LAWESSNNAGQTLHVTDLSTSTTADLVSADWYLGDADVSPDGRFVAFSSSSPALRPGPTDSNCHVSYGIEDPRYTQRRPCDEIYLYDRTTAVTVPVTGALSSSTGDNGVPQFTEDGRYVMYTSSPSDLGYPEAIHRWDRQTGTTELVAPITTLYSTVRWSSDGRWRFDGDNGPVTATDTTTNVTDTVTDVPFAYLHDVTADGSAALVNVNSGNPRYWALVDRVTHTQRVLQASPDGGVVINGDASKMVAIKAGDAFHPTVMYLVSI
jgi:hypothetical protein